MPKLAKPRGGRHCEPSHQLNSLQFLYLTAGFGQTPADQLDAPGGPLDAIEIVARQRLALVPSRERAGRRADYRQRPARRLSPLERVQMIVAVNDELGAVLRQDSFEVSRVAQRPRWLGLTRQRRVMDEHKPEQFGLAHLVEQPAKPLA